LPSEVLELCELPEGSSWQEMYQRTQSYEEFCRGMPFRPNSRSNSIELVVVGGQQALSMAVDVELLMIYMRAFLGMAVYTRDDPLKMGDWTQVRRSGDFDQHSAEAVVARLSETVDLQSSCTLGLTTKDLYPPKDFAYVTGYTAAKHHCGVFSTLRYFVNKLGPEGSTQRIQKEGYMRDTLTLILVRALSREALKLCGMAECRMLRCLMNPPPDGPPERMEEMRLELCILCMRKLSWLTQKDPLDRLSDLPSVLMEGFPEEVDRLERRMKEVGMPTYRSCSDPGVHAR